MKFLTTLIAAMSAPAAEGSVRTLIRVLLVLGGSIVVFTVGFQVVMAYEGREFTWFSAVYWALVTMTTLGYGDIVFQTDLGRMYSLVVLVGGAILILVMLPFTFVQLVYLPWRAAMRRAQAPRELPEETSGHVIIAGLGPIEEALIRRLEAAGVTYTVLVDDIEDGIGLHDDGYKVAVGAMDDPDTYRAVRAEQAAMLFTARTDTTNTHAAFTLREVTERGIVVATADSEDAVDILELAGCDRVLELGELLGRALARRILAPTARSSIVATFEDLVIAEASAGGTQLVGRSLTELGLRERFGVNVVGVWERGSLQAATPDQVIDERSIVLLAGTREQLEAYDDAFAPSDAPRDGDARDAETDGQLVIILGGGRVGRATARALREADIPCRVVERLEERIERLPAEIREDGDYVLGDAADREVLRRAGIEDASAVVVTTHDDDMNLYLTLYCRRLRPDIEILGRVTTDRNLRSMHRAGADFVLSYASMGATEAWNALRGDSRVLLAEGLVIFRVPMSKSLAGRTLRDTEIPAETGCYVIALMRDGEVSTDLDPDDPLPVDAEVVLIGDDEAEDRFLSRYVAGAHTSGLWDRWRRSASRT